MKSCKQTHLALNPIYHPRGKADYGASLLRFSDADGIVYKI